MKMAKENKIKQLEDRIREHEQLHRPNKNLWKELLGFIVSLCLAIANFFLIINTWKLLGLGDLTEEHLTSLSQLLICYPLVFEYVFISLTIICFVAIHKNGFENLKKYNEEGLIYCLIYGLIGGLIVGLIGGLIGEFN